MFNLTEEDLDNVDAIEFNNSISQSTCNFNFFSSATNFKNYYLALAKAPYILLENEEIFNKMGVKLDVKCSKHGYALYGANGKVVKDGDDPKVTYDLDSTGKKGEASLSDIVEKDVEKDKSSSGNMINIGFRIFTLFILVLF